MRCGKIVHVLSCAGSEGVVPQLQHVHPMALHTGSPEQLLLTGSNLAILNNRVLARCLGEPPALLKATCEAISLHGLTSGSKCMRERPPNRLCDPSHGAQIREQYWRPGFAVPLWAADIMGSSSQPSRRGAFMNSGLIAVCCGMQATTWLWRCCPQGFMTRRGQRTGRATWRCRSRRSSPPASCMWRWHAAPSSADPRCPSRPSHTEPIRGCSAAASVIICLQSSSRGALRSGFSVCGALQPNGPHVL